MPPLDPTLRRMLEKRIVEARDASERADETAIRPPPDAWAGVFREARLSALLSGEDDLTKVKQFFLDGIAKLEEDLKVLKGQHPGLSWEGGA